MDSAIQYMPEDGDIRLLHVTPDGVRKLGTIESTGDAVVDTPAAPMSPHERAEAHLSEVMDLSGAPVDVTWELDVKMSDELHEMMSHDMGHKDGMNHDDDMDHGEHENGPPPIE